MRKRLPQRYALLFPFLLLLLLTTSGWAQLKAPLPRSTPEAEGVSSEGILHFMQAIEKSKNEFHSFMLLRHGKVIAEGWWEPYAPSLKHTLYSLSKSFTSTAVGLAISEGRLKTSDHVISFFPNELPDTLSGNLRALTVKDLLTMSVGQSPDPTGQLTAKDTNWVRAFLALPLTNKPGSTFLYNSMSTFMLSAIVQKVTGQRVVDYLRPRLFEPLGIEGIDWETSPKGINTGGWGLRLKTEDIAKMGQLYLQKGKWKGKQLLPQSWVEEATSFKILQSPDMPQSKRDSSDWQQGYCYQFWRCRHNCYRGDGAFGQYMIVMPQQDAVLAITSETADMQDELNLVWNYLLPAMDQPHKSLTATASGMLKQTLAHLSLPVGHGERSTEEATLNGKTITFAPNNDHLKALILGFTASHCLITLTTDTAAYTIGFAANSWEKGTTNRPGPYLLEHAHNNRSGLAPYKVAGQYYWSDPHTLELTLRYIESPHTERMHLHVEGNEVTLTSNASFTPKVERLNLKGSWK